MRTCHSLTIALLFASLTATGATPSLPAQASPGAVRSSIVGTVRDASGAPIAQAQVRLPLLDREVTSSTDGTFRLTGLPAAPVVVTVRSVGHAPWNKTIPLSAGTPYRLDVQLTAASVQLVPVVVTGAATTSDPTTPLDVAAIDPLQLKSVSTASIGKTLERVPGVATIPTGPMAGNPVLRGMSQGQVRLTRDGVPIESFQGTSRWTPPMSFGSVDRVEVIRGPASVLYGSSAMGGAINFLPKTLPRADDGRTKLGGLIETQYFGNNDERYANGELSVALGSLGFRGGYNRRVAGNFNTADAATYDESKQVHAPRYTGELPFTNYDQRAAYGQAGLAGTWGQAQLLYDDFKGFNNFLNANGKPTGVAMANKELRARGTLLLGRFVVKPSISQQDLHIQRAATASATFESARENNSWDQDLLRSVTTARVEGEHPAIGGVAGKIGVELQQQRGTTRLSAIEPSSRIRNAAAFAFEEYRFSRVTLSSGVRYDHRTQDAAMGTLVSALPVDEQERALHRTFDVVNGSVGAGVRLTSALTWTSNVSTGFRAPAIQDLYTNENRPAFGWLEGNPQLKPERSTSIESSLRWQGSRAAATVTAYRNSVANYIYMENTGRTKVVSGQTRNVYVNTQANGIIRGVEASGEGELLPRLFAEASYMALRSENRATGEALPLMPADQVRASLRYQPRRTLFISAPFVRLGLRHSSAKRIAGLTEPFAEFDKNPAGYGISSTPAYAVWNVQTGGRIATLARSPIDVTVEVENLLDTPYRDFLDTQKGFALAQGRNVSVRLSAPLSFGR